MTKKLQGNILECKCRAMEKLQQKQTVITQADNLAVKQVRGKSNM